jgi:hypothetical protein
MNMHVSAWNFLYQQIRSYSYYNTWFSGSTARDSGSSLFVAVRDMTKVTELANRMEKHQTSTVLETVRWRGWRGTPQKSFDTQLITIQICKYPVPIITM